MPGRHPRPPAATGRAQRGRPDERAVGRPVLVRQIRNGIVEPVHRGDIVEVDVAGRMVRSIGDPDRIVTLRSSVKPFGLVALLEAGGIDAFDLSPAELAIMASSHSGEDLHVRTLQALYRRAGVTQTVLACGTEGMPLDALTAARLARDGERAGPIRHMCSGQQLGDPARPDQGWPLETTGRPITPARRRTGRRRGRLPDDAGATRTAIDGCGILTYAFTLAEVARAFAFLADPAGIPAGDPRPRLAASLTRIRDAMLGHPEMVAGSRERLDTSLMKAVPGRVVSKGGMEALRGVAILRLGATDLGIRPGHQDRGRRRLRARNMGGDGRGAPPGRRPRRPPRCASSPATTGRPRSTRMDESSPRRSPSSTSRRWAS